MEELLSADSIHKEILDDARRKAAKILKSAAETKAREDSKWEAKLRTAAAKIKTQAEQEVAAKRAQAQSRLLMDKARIKLEKIDASLKNANNAFFASLDKSEIEKILENEMAKRVKIALETLPCTELSGEAAVSGISASQAKSMFARLNVKISHIEEEPLSAGGLPYITLRTKEAALSASIEALSDEILLKRRAEAAEALFGQV